MKKTEWDFTVSDAELIDLQRILDEAPESAVSVIVSDGESTSAVAIRNSFLDKFNSRDECRVAGESLCPSWGLKGAAPRQHGRSGFVFEDYIGQSSAVMLSGWRWRRTGGDDISKVENEIKGAKKYERRICVKVACL
jgi:hypothetical protein